MVPRRRLELPCLAALLPESSASTNSATWAQVNGAAERNRTSDPVITNDVLYH